VRKQRRGQQPSRKVEADHLHTALTVLSSSEGRRDCTGNVTVMRQGRWKPATAGWGVSVTQDKKSPQARFNSSLAGSGRGPHLAARAGGLNVPRIVDLVHGEQIQIDPMITHIMPLGESLRTSVGTGRTQEQQTSGILSWAQPSSLLWTNIADPN